MPKMYEDNIQSKHNGLNVLALLWIFLLLIILFLFTGCGSCNVCYSDFDENGHGHGYVTIPFCNSCICGKIETDGFSYVGTNYIYDASTIFEDKQGTCFLGCTSASSIDSNYDLIVCGSSEEELEIGIGCMNGCFCAACGEEIEFGWLLPDIYTKDRVNEQLDYMLGRTDCMGNPIE